MTVAYYGYLGTALGYGLLALLLLLSWRSSAQGRLLTAVVVATLIWALFAMSMAVSGYNQSAGYHLFEVLRYILWYLFLLKLFEPAAHRIVGHTFLRHRARHLFAGFGVLVILLEMTELHAPAFTALYDITEYRFLGHVFLAIIALAIIEQLYRNLTAEHRRTLKYLFIGSGLVFAFDFYMYANAMLFRKVDGELWAARGFVNLFAVPLLILAAARNRNWSPNFFISRDIILHSTAIIGSGVYLLLMAGAGYYLQAFGGNWGRIAKIAFFSGALVVLFMMLFSHQIRRRLRVFLGKHFYRNKYDYRREWLSLTSELVAGGNDDDSYETAIKVLAQLVDARSGLLWLRDGQGEYTCRSSWGTKRVDGTEPDSSSLIRFLAGKGYVIDLHEVVSQQEEYEGLQLPEWIERVEHGWLIVPLRGAGVLLGFVVLARPVVIRELNWEDHDLLKTAAHQVAGHLAVVMTAGELAQAKQFEVFNRLSAYMVHDLKNVAAGLELVAKNAQRHRDNPAFLADAFESVAAASADIKRLLDQLRSKHAQTGKQVLVELPDLLRRVVERRSNSVPVPVLECADAPCRVTADRRRLENVLVHLVENAQQATTREGHVHIKLSMAANACVVEITDDGRGMSADFVRERLFKPFDTTKGNAGMGIGMYESREFIHELGGEIQVTSSPGEGTRITLSFPAVENRDGVLSAPPLSSRIHR